MEETGLRPRKNVFLLFFPLFFLLDGGRCPSRALLNSSYVSEGNPYFFNLMKGTPHVSICIFLHEINTSVFFLLICILNISMWNMFINNRILIIDLPGAWLGKKSDQSAQPGNQAGISAQLPAPSPVPSCPRNPLPPSRGGGVSEPITGAKSCSPPAHGVLMSTRAGSLLPEIHLFPSQHA